MHALMAAGKKALVEAELKGLEKTPTPELRRRWQDAYGRPTPPHMSRGLLLLSLAYRIQERAFGGLSEATRKKLLKIAADLERDPNCLEPKGPRIKAGTRLVKEWKGEVHEVTVEPDGYTYRNKRYGSLSEIARQITGTRWSGPLFFGLKNAT
ncbi:MAG: DUF2924 domain-containing protein [Alphaproteobacteria bacterium]